MAPDQSAAKRSRRPQGSVRLARQAGRQRHLLLCDRRWIHLTRRARSGYRHDWIAGWPRTRRLDVLLSAPTQEVPTYSGRYLVTMLPTYVSGWRESADTVLTLAQGLDPTDGAMSTDCPDWPVQDVIAHLAHLESVLCGEASDDGAAGAAELVSSYTEAGVVERRQASLADVIEQLRTAVEIRSEQLRDLPDDSSLPAPVTPGGIDWSWDVLLRNRCLDMWVHEQDIRRALHRPGGLDTTAAQVATMTFSFAMPYVLGKRVKPAAGTTVRWDVTGEIA